MANYGQNNRPSTENGEEKLLTDFEMFVSENILNEKWYNNENENMTFIPKDSIELIAWYGQMHNGTDCYFYEDSTFKIRLWWYGVSSGLHDTSIKGHYHYNPTTKEIILIFDAEWDKKSRHNEPIPVSYYVMKGLSERRLPFWGVDDKDFPIFSKTCLKVVEQTESGKILVDLYAYKENGEMVSFGQQTYIREYLN